MKAQYLIFCAVVFVDASSAAPEDAVRYQSDNSGRTNERTFLRDINNSTPFSFEGRDVRRNSSYYSESQLTTPVPEDDFWWYFTTSRRPFFSARDYPGKPGVATWKEILPGVTNDKRKDKKLEQPRAAGVSNSANEKTWKGLLILFVIMLFGIQDSF